MGDLNGAGDPIFAAVRGGRIPGVVAMAGRGPRTLATWVAGQADTTPGAIRSMRAGTVFDLASLTKVVATTTVILALAARGDLGLEDPVADYLPEFRAGPVTIRQLLAHTSGLPASRQFYLWCADRAELMRDLFETAPQDPPGARVTYSDLGFLLLGEIAAAAAGEPLDTAAGRLVTRPLGMTHAAYHPAAAAGGFAAGEPETGGVAPDGFAATERRADGRPWTGVVHDENARLMGGVAGHAGLFGTAADLARFAAWWVSEDDGPVPVTLRRQAGSCQTAGLGGCRGLGWVRGGDRYDILGGHWPPTAISHTGFTGTSLALDAPSGVWVVLLTNAVHFGRDATAVKELRHSVHAAVASALF